MEFARRHERPLLFSGRIDTEFGSQWMIRVFSRPQAPLKRVYFLPGTEASVFSAAARASMAGRFKEALADFAKVRGQLPGVLSLDAMEGHVLMLDGRYPESYVLLRAGLDAGLVFRWNLLDMAVVAGETGRRMEACSALIRAREVNSAWLDGFRERLARLGLGDCAREGVK